MGKKDIALVRYLEEEERYADLLNGFLFYGDRVVSGTDVQDKNPVLTGAFGKLKEYFALEKYRDAVRKVVFGLNFVLIGIENQDQVHYAMPVRIMLEDAAGYDEQMRQIQRWNRKAGKLSGAEFLGRFKKKDRLKAIFTIVLYWGERPWDGAAQLHELIDFSGVPECVRQMVGNYRIHILEVRRFEAIDRFQTDLREVFGFIRNSGDKTMERKFTFDNSDKFERIDEEAYDVITALTGSRELETVKEKYREKGGKINMCEAIRGMIEDGRVEGRVEGRREGSREKSRLVARNMYLRGMTAEDTALICEEELEQVKQWYEEWQKS